MDAIIRVTREQFLADNPSLTDEDYEFYKKWSDRDLHKLYKHNRREGRDHSLLREDLVHENHAPVDQKRLELATLYSDRAWQGADNHDSLPMITLCAKYEISELVEREHIMEIANDPKH